MSIQSPFHSEALEGLELKDVGSSRLCFFSMDRKTYHLPFDSLAELELHLKGEELHKWELIRN